MYRILVAMVIAMSAPVAAQPVAVLVAVPVPAGMSRPQLEGLFKAAAPDYRKLPGLVRKYFTIGDDGRAGGIYLWSSRAAAEAWYSDAWKAGVQKRWGAPASVSYFDVPVITDGLDSDGGAK